MYTIEKIKEDIYLIANKYDLESVELFGSYASGKETPNSDIDFLVKFNKEIPSIFEVAGLQYELEKKLSVPVDVVTLPIINKKKFSIAERVFLYGKEK